MVTRIVSQIAIVAAVTLVSCGAAFSQASPVGASATVTCVPKGLESTQPVAPSAVILNANGSVSKAGMALNLSTDQVSKLAAMNQNVAALQAERTRLWSEFRAVVARPGYNDAIAHSQAKPKMDRIMAINAMLKPIVAQQEIALRAVLSPEQHNQVSQIVASAKSSL